MCDSGGDEHKQKLVQVYLDGTPGYCVPFDKAKHMFEEELDCLDDESELSFKIIYRTEKELEAAGEFEGW